MKRRALIGAAVLAPLTVAGCTRPRTEGVSPSPGRAGSATPTAKAVTSGGGTVPFTPGKVKLGAYVELSDLAMSAGLALRRRQLGRRERIVHRFYSWTDALPVSLSSVSRTSYLMVSWRGPHYADITSGSSDRMIAAAARRMRARGRPTLLRWGWDMNRDYYRWGGAANNRNTGAYRTAWRRLHRIFGEEGADNVSWVWSPNGASIPDATWNTWDAYYPGDEYVDWAGVAGYARAQTPGDLFDAFYAAYAPRKPIMITEVSAVDRGGDTKAQWITAFRSWVKKRPAIGGVVWFDTDTHPGSEENWRVDSSTSSLAAYKAMAADPVFGG